MAGDHFLMITGVDGDVVKKNDVLSVRPESSATDADGWGSSLIRGASGWVFMSDGWIGGDEDEK